MLYGTEDKIIGSDWKNQEKSDNSTKLDDLGEWENRKKYFIKRDDYIYQQTNGCDNFYNKWLIINDTLIKSDSEWLSKQSTTKIDLDLAYKYMEELTNRFEPLLKKVEGCRTGYQTYAMQYNKEIIPNIITIKRIVRK